MRDVGGDQRDHAEEERAAHAPGSQLAIDQAKKARMPAEREQHRDEDTPRVDRALAGPADREERDDAGE